jgi:hypothetical protein
VDPHAPNDAARSRAETPLAYLRNRMLRLKHVRLRDVKGRARPLPPYQAIAALR